jgi:transcriptional regulator with XRE-family HTH domain
MSKLSRYIQKRRVKLGISQAALARELGMSSPQMISNIERSFNGCALPPSHFRKVSCILEIDMGKIISMYVGDIKNKLYEEYFYGT